MRRVLYPFEGDVGESVVDECDPVERVEDFGLLQGDVEQTLSLIQIPFLSGAEEKNRNKITADKWN